MTFNATIKSACVLAALVFSLAGCNSNPAADRADIQKARSVTVVCCDSISNGAIVSGNSIYGGALLGAFAGGAVGAAATRSAMGGNTDDRTQRFLDKAAHGPLNLPADFARAVVDSLKAKGIEADLVFPMGFDGYNNRYAIDSSQIKGELLLEVRYAGQIVNHAERFFPTFATTFSVRRSSDRKMLNSGVLAVREPRIPAPSFGDANVLRAPMLLSLGPIALFRYAEFMDLTEQQVIKGDDADLMKDAARLAAATSTVNRELAALLVSRIDQMKQ